MQEKLSRSNMVIQFIWRNGQRMFQHVFLQPSGDFNGSTEQFLEAGCEMCLTERWQDGLARLQSPCYPTAL